MESIFEEFDHEEIPLNEKEIFTEIWKSPRVVFKFINETGYSKYTTILLVLSGITYMLSNATTRHLGDVMPLWGVLMACLIGGAVFGWLYFYIYAALLSWTGKWLNGVGNTKALLRMISYALIPMLAFIILFIIRIALFGNEVFQREFDIAGKGIPAIGIYVFTYFIELVTLIWTIVLLVIGISEVQKLSIGKALLNMILPGLLLFAVCIPIAAIAFIVGDFFK